MVDAGGRVADPVLLNNVDHAGLRVAIAHGAAFGDVANRIDLLPTEFADASRDFPILFRRTGTGPADYAAFALLGFDADENLFFDGDRWTSSYIPAVQQRGPFSIGLTRGADGPAGAPMIHVDLDDPRVGRDDGQPLFRPHGGNAPLLDAIVRVLEALYIGIETAPAMFAGFVAENLIEPVTLDIAMPDGTRYRLPDCHTISAERLAALDGAALERLHRSGHLAPAFFVAASLRIMARLIDLKAGHGQ